MKNINTKMISITTIVKRELHQKYTRSEIEVHHVVTEVHPSEIRSTPKYNYVQTQSITYLQTRSATTLKSKYTQCTTLIVLEYNKKNWKKHVNIGSSFKDLDSRNSKVKMVHNLYELFSENNFFEKWDLEKKGKN
jgi:hypothetical protein